MKTHFYVHSNCIYMTQLGGVPSIIVDFYAHLKAIMIIFTVCDTVCSFYHLNIDVFAWLNGYEV